MNKHTGSDFDGFLKDEGILVEVTARAHGRLLALELEDIAKLADRPFIGMWRDREDMQDSSTWTRHLREREWQRDGGGEQ